MLLQLMLGFVSKTSLNDDFCLPNKLFECIFAGIPVYNDSDGVFMKNIKWALWSMN